MGLSVLVGGRGGGRLIHGRRRCLGTLRLGTVCSSSCHCFYRVVLFRDGRGGAEGRLERVGYMRWEGKGCLWAAVLSWGSSTVVVMAPLIGLFFLFFSDFSVSMSSALPALLPCLKRLGDKRGWWVATARLNALRTMMCIFKDSGPG